MIKSFEHKGLAKLFSDGDGRKVSPQHIEKLRKILLLLNVARNAYQLQTLPGFHPLKGKLKGYFAVSVDKNYRVTFTFKAGHAEEVDYVDYH